MLDMAPLLEALNREQAQAVDFRFTDIAGRWCHIGVPEALVQAGLKERHLMFDGSAFTGWRDAVESDLTLLPDLDASWLDPFSAQPQIVVVADVGDPATGAGYERCPRSILERAAAFLAAEIDGATLRAGIDLAFYLEPNQLADAGRAASPDQGRDRRSSYLVGTPVDLHADLRSEMATSLARLGVVDVRHHHGRSPGQAELQLGPREVLAMADRLQLAKDVVHNVARAYGHEARFLPKPSAALAGSWLHLHLALWQDEKPLFAGTGYADLSDICAHFLAGILRHARALNAFANPTTNSYRRLRGDLKEPTLLAYAALNRSTAVRIPYTSERAEKRIELRFPDPEANPYLLLAATLMAGLDGILNQLDPGDPIDRNLYDLPPEDLGSMARACRSLEEALDALERDHEFLLEGEVMGEELVRTYLALKRHEVAAVERAPHPLETGG